MHWFMDYNRPMFRLLHISLIFSHILMASWITKFKPFTAELKLGSTLIFQSYCEKYTRLLFKYTLRITTKTRSKASLRACDSPMNMLQKNTMYGGFGAIEAISSLPLCLYCGIQMMSSGITQNSLGDASRPHQGIKVI